MKGLMVIISAPSGAGKSTIAAHLLKSGLNLEFSVSATTRKPRGEERDGIDYYFLSVEEFKRKIQNNEFLEWEEVYRGKFYGTLKSEIDRIWSNGNHVLFDVDVKGGVNLKNIFGKKALSIFLMPPSVNVLEKRLLNRKTDDLQGIRIRVAKAAEEMKLADEFDNIIINDNLEQAENDAYNIVLGFIENG
jgi:guanylate kinase